MSVFVTYCYSTAAWLALQATPMIISPTIIVTLLSPEVHQTTALEEYFSRSLGFSLLALAVLCLALAGIFTGSNISSDAAAPTADPYTPATIIVTTVYNFATGFYAYGQFVRTRQTSFMLGVIGSGVMAAMGVWCVLFGGQAAKISKRTGADKRTSGWPFGNVEADKKRVGKKTR